MSLYTKIAFHQTKYKLKRVHPAYSCELRYGASGSKQCGVPERHTSKYVSVLHPEYLQAISVFLDATASLEVGMSQ